MGESRPSDLTIILINYTMRLTVDEVMAKFAEIAPRRADIVVDLNNFN